MNDTSLKELIEEQLLGEGFEVDERECFTVTELSGRTQRITAYQRGEFWVTFTETLSADEVPFNHGLALLEGEE